MNAPESPPSDHVPAGDSFAAAYVPPCPPSCPVESVAPIADASGYFQ